MLGLRGLYRPLQQKKMFCPPGMDKALPNSWPFFHRKFLHWQDAWRFPPMYPQYFNGIQIWLFPLTRSFHNPSVLPPLSVSVVRIIIPLKGPLLVRLQFSDRWPHIVFKHSLKHSWINDCKLPSPWGREVTPKHNISTTMLHSFYKGLLLESCLPGLHQMCLLSLRPNNSSFQKSAQSTLIQWAWPCVNL